MSMTKRWAAVGLLAMLAGACGEAGEQDFEPEGELDQELARIPRRVEAEAYDRFSEKTPASNAGAQCDRGDGVDKETTTDPTGGICNIGWTDAGEWLEYDLNVASDALYTIDLRLAADAAGRAVHAELDGVNLGSLPAPSGGWQAWADRSYPNVAITAGNHVLRIVFDTGLVNFNYFNVTQGVASCTDGIKNGSETGVDCGGSCGPCATGCLSQVLPPALAVSSANESAQLSAPLAIDNNTATRWASPYSDPQWIYVDLGATRKINRVVLNWEAAYSLNYDVQVTDNPNGSWTTIYSTSSGNGGIDDLSNLDGTGRYVRVYSRARGTQWGNSLWEVTVYGDPNPSCSNTTPTCTDGIQNGTETGVDCGGNCPACAATCTDGIQNGTETGVDCGGSCPACATTCVEQALSRATAVASTTENATYPATNAVDASTTTRWSSVYADPQWIYVDLGARRRVSRVRLNWEVAASRSYDLQTADSASGPWTTIYSTNAGDGGLDDIGNLNGVGRYVRMYSRSRTTQWGVSLFDFAVLGDSNPNCVVVADTDGDRLPDSVETGTGVYVSPTNTGTSPNNFDTDGDGLPDGDEVLGTTAGLNLPAMGVSPVHKNILLEYDWFDDALDCEQHSHRPAATLFPRLNAAFANAPVSNPDGTTGITLINDYGQGGAFTGGNLILDADGIVDGFGVEYNAYRAANFAQNRAGYFHYVIMPHQYNNRSNFSSGLASLVGSDMIVSLYCARSDENVGNTIMHELGHNLGLHHGGFEFVNNKPNYNSVMNYSYQFPGVDNNCTPPGDGVLDYSRNQRITLDENALNEAAGICGGVAWDWNFSTTIESNVAFDLNGDGLLQTLRDYDDWANLVYDFAPGLGAGTSPNRSAAPVVAHCDNPAPMP